MSKVKLVKIENCKDEIINSATADRRKSSIRNYIHCPTCGTCVGKVEEKIPLPKIEVKPLTVDDFIEAFEKYFKLLERDGKQPY